MVFFRRLIAIIWSKSLRRRLILLLLLSTLIPITCIGTISYYAIYSFLNDKIEKGYVDQVNQVRISLEHTLSNLDYASQQLAYSGNIGRDLEKYLDSVNPSDQSIIGSAMEEEITAMTFTNPNLGIMFYYLKDKNEFLFNPLPLRVDMDLQSLPLLESFQEMSYYGPHRTLNRLNDDEVFSVIRRVDIPGNKNIYVYLETNLNLVKSILKPYDGIGSAYLLLDHTNRIAYSGFPDSFHVGDRLTQLTNNRTIDKKQGFYFFQTASNQGWKVVSAVPMNVYDREKNQWARLFILLGALSLILSLIIGLVIWRMVYSRLTRIGKEINIIGINNVHEPVRLSGLNEFDVLLIKFESMRGKIIDLLDTVKEDEKKKAALEVEKVLNQINPHFIHNTLDTIRWIARMNGQIEIDKLISTLNKVLYYNLGKGKTSTIREEIEALEHYISLQRIRYNFDFQVHIEADPGLSDIAIPRFILQPLVENALYHGAMDNGKIIVLVQNQNYESILFTVEDNGAGIPEEKIRLMLESVDGSSNKSGLGIGLNYVYRMLLFQYGAQSSFHIDSKPEYGTKINIRIPYPKGGKSDEEHINRR